MFDLGTYIVLTQSVTLACGGLVTLLALRAHRRTGSRALRSLALGLGLVTVGGLVAGGIHQFTGLGIATAVAVQGTFTGLGFAVLASSLFVRESDALQPIGRLRG